MKECRTCHQTKPLEEFYPLAKSRSHLGDGRQAVCKECIKARARSPERQQMSRDSWAKRFSILENREKERARAKDFYERHKNDPDFKARHKIAHVKWRNTTNGREITRQNCARFRQTEAFKDAVLRSRAKHPEKRACRTAFWNALQAGKVKRPSTCSVCGKQCVPHGHHPDYSKPLEVVWVCHKCHCEYHWGRP